MGTLDFNSIRNYLIEVGCKVEYPILVNAFKDHLYNPDPVIQGDIRTKFKDYVNKLATVSVENKMKFITLRPEFKVTSYTPRWRRWAIEASNCNLNNLLALLREDPKLASNRDIVNGYTAIHWAAKFGDANIIKLLIGTYNVPVNIKSSAGHTPLHVAYMFKRLEVANLLLTKYQADPDIRDHSGKKPMQLLSS